MAGIRGVSVPGTQPHLPRFRAHLPPHRHTHQHCLWWGGGKEGTAGGAGVGGGPEGCRRWHGGGGGGGRRAVNAYAGSVVNVIRYKNKNHYHNLGLIRGIQRACGNKQTCLFQIVTRTTAARSSAVRA